MLDFLIGTRLSDLPSISLPTDPHKVRLRNPVAIRGQQDRMGHLPLDESCNGPTVVLFALKVDAQPVGLVLGDTRAFHCTPWAPSKIPRTPRKGLPKRRPRHSITPRKTSATTAARSTSRLTRSPSLRHRLLLASISNTPHTVTACVPPPSARPPGRPPPYPLWNTGTPRRLVPQHHGHDTKPVHWIRRSGETVPVLAPNRLCGRPRPVMPLAPPTSSCRRGAYAFSLSL